MDPALYSFVTPGIDPTLIFQILMLSRLFRGLNGQGILGVLSGMAEKAELKLKWRFIFDGVKRINKY